MPQGLNFIILGRGQLADVFSSLYSVRFRLRVGVIKIVIVINCNLITFSKVIVYNCN